MSYEEDVMYALISNLKNKGINISPVTEDIDISFEIDQINRLGYGNCYSVDCSYVFYRKGTEKLRFDTTCILPVEALMCSEKAIMNKIIETSLGDHNSFLKGLNFDFPIVESNRRIFATIEQMGIMSDILQDTNQKYQRLWRAFTNQLAVALRDTLATSNIVHTEIVEMIIALSYRCPSRAYYDSEAYVIKGTDFIFKKDINIVIVKGSDDVCRIISENHSSLKRFELLLEITEMEDGN